MENSKFTSKYSMFVFVASMKFMMEIFGGQLKCKSGFRGFLGRSQNIDPWVRPYI